MLDRTIDRSILFILYTNYSIFSVRLMNFFLVFCLFFFTTFLFPFGSFIFFSSFFLSRYLYDLSREVQDMVRILKSTEDASAARINELEYIVRDWNDIFAYPSSSLQEIGINRQTNSPSAIARLLRQQYETIQQNEIDTLSLKVTLEKEINDLRSSLREASRVSREQASYELSTLKMEADKVITNERTAKEIAIKELDNLRRTMNDEIRTGIEKEVANQTAAIVSEMNRLRQSTDQEMKNAALARGKSEAELTVAIANLRECQEEKQRLEETHTAERTSLQQQISSLKEELRSAEKIYQTSLNEIECNWRNHLLSAHEQWSKATSTIRVAQLETQITFLTERLTTVQQLWETTQQALGMDGGLNQTNYTVPPQLPFSQPSSSANVGAKKPIINLPPARTNVAPRGNRPLRTVAVVRHAGIEENLIHEVPTETRYIHVR